MLSSFIFETGDAEPADVCGPPEHTEEHQHQQVSDACPPSPAPTETRMPAGPPARTEAHDVDHADPLKDWSPPEAEAWQVVIDQHKVREEGWGVLRESIREGRTFAAAVTAEAQASYPCAQPPAGTAAAAAASASPISPCRLFPRRLRAELCACAGVVARFHRGGGADGRAMSRARS